MTSCTVEAINAIWTALAFVVAVLILIKVGFVLKGEDELASLFWIMAAALSIGSHHYGQQAVRYYGADQQGAECVYGDSGNIKVVWPESQRRRSEDHE